jgi:hypothetical protein
MTQASARARKPRPGRVLKHDLTVPWMEGELIRVDGQPLAYVAQQGDLYVDWRVLFACGQSATVADLQAEGRRVRLPKYPRYQSSGVI